jgi:hypothetical protein
MLAEAFYLELKRVLNSTKSKNLVWCELYDFLEEHVWPYGPVMKELYLSNPIFRNLFLEHFVEKKQRFSHFRNLESSFAASWLTELYST